jgi:3',5'-cyclic AMP phosphodiesterase CpdA
MRRIAHLSDLHFGTEDGPVVESVIQDVAKMQPDLVVVTGDLTQRARRRQFQAARAFLDRLAAPKLVVPGNHDIPLYNVAARFGWPLAGYRQWITGELRPTYADGEIAVAGLNTARSNTWKDGRVSHDDIAWFQGFFCLQSPDKFKILATHHAFIPPEHDPLAALVGRAPEALSALGECGCHLILAGHLHFGYSGDVRPHHEESERSILVVQAGTAVSRRRRKEPNAYNLLTVDGRRLELDVRVWRGEFMTAQLARFELSNDSWKRLDS